MTRRTLLVVGCIATLLAFFGPAASAPSASASAHLLKDINTTVISDSYPSGFHDLGAVTVFTAWTPAAGSELWRTDGTMDGTFLLEDIRPGPSDGILAQYPGPLMVNVGGVLFFVANDGAHGAELWKTDGTAAGTLLVKDIVPGAASAGPRDLVALDGILLFVATDPIHGMELWKSDGTADGTVLVKDIVPGSIASNPQELTRSGHSVFFRDSAINHEEDLWKTDGTDAGTARVKDIDPGFPHYLFDAEGTLYFIAHDGVHGEELWKSDGSEAGTTMVTDLTPGAGQSFVGQFAAARGLLFFDRWIGGSDHELWRTDGAEAGTVRLNASLEVFDTTVIQDTLFLSASDGIRGIELWKSDGTESGTVLVKDIRQGPDPEGLGSYPYDLCELDGTLYFSADDGVHGNELWKSDGTEVGTTRVKDIRQGFLGSVSVGLTAVGGALLFPGNDGMHGVELWKSDGTEAGTVLVKDIWALFQTEGSYPWGQMAFIGGRLIFSALDDSHGYELWGTNGTEEGTNLIKDIRPSTYDSQLYEAGVNGNTITAFGDVALFLGYDDTHGWELWRTDGTETGTVLVKDVRPGPVESNAALSSLTSIAFNGKLFFYADDGVHGLEPWTTDGTEAGTTLVADIRPGPLSSLPQYWGPGFVPFNGCLFFRADDGIHGFELWKTDGTAAGTLLVADLNPSGGSGAYPLAVVDGTLFLAADDEVHGSELWKTDGTAAGTVLVRDIKPGPFPSGPGLAFAEMNGHLFFTADDGVHATELWKSDGTAEGTVLVKDIHPGQLISSVNQMTVFGGQLFFTAEDGVHGAELWKSDGTAAGTALVKDIKAGSAGSFIFNLTLIEGILLFSADDGIHGSELWRSDGTPKGTFLVQDISPGDGGSGPGPFDRLGDRIVFPAQDDVHGVEPWIGRAAILTVQPQRAIQDLKEEVKTLHLPAGIERGLMSKLDAAASALSAGNDARAAGALLGFVQQVEGLSPLWIREPAAAELIAFAQEILGLVEHSAHAVATHPLSTDEVPNRRLTELSKDPASKE